MITLLLIALASASISYTVTTTGIFKYVREKVASLHPKIDELIHCPYCFGHYVVLVIYFSIIDVNSLSLLSILLELFAIVGIMGMIHYVLIRAYLPISQSKAKKLLDSLNNEANKKI